jgi:CRISPR type III-B/RAMP module-associated protein Cmr5
MPRLREQDRALEALKTVQGLASRKDAADYRQQFQQLPSRILASGLGQTMAFSASKGGKEAEVAATVATFLLRRRATAIDLLAEIMSKPTTEYRARTREALAYAEWLKRYAVALIEKSEK